MSQKAISVKVLGQLRNAHVQFAIGLNEADGYYVMTAGQGFMRITLNTDENNLIKFLETTLEQVRRGQNNQHS